MKFLPILEKGDTFTTSTGLERTVWKAVIMYIDTEGVIHGDVESEQCSHEGSTLVPPWTKDVMDCPTCGIWFEGEEPEFIAFTSDLLNREGQ